MNTLPELDLVKGHLESYSGSTASISFEPLYPGYGHTLGNSLRRILLSSLPGAAITSITVGNINHEFSTLTGIREEILEIILNLKQIRFQLHGEGPVVLTLLAKGAKTVTAKSFAPNAEMEIINPDAPIATLSKEGQLQLSVTVEAGRGYLPVERREKEKLPIGTIAIDAIFTPIRAVNYTVENTRVGGMTNFDKLILEITTDGSITPQYALEQAAQILNEHAIKVADYTKTVESPKITAKRTSVSSAGRGKPKTPKTTTLKKTKPLDVKKTVAKKIASKK